MRVMVTGGTGFIGRSLMSRLGSHEVLLLSRQDPQGMTVGNVSPNVTFLKGNLGEPGTWLDQATEYSPHCCVHLAWEGLPDYSPTRCQYNLKLGLRLLDGLARLRIGRILVAGSCWEYGAANGAVAEFQNGAEDGAFVASKTALRAALETMAREIGTTYRWARIFFAYGPAQRASSLIPQCRAAFRAGKTPDIREPRVAQDFIYVDDVAAGLLALIECDMASGIYNLGTGTPAAAAEVANIAAGHFGMIPPYPDPRFDRGFWADTSKMTKATGWNARTTLGDGIARTLNALETA